MATEAQGRATRKYRAKAYDRIEVQVPKGTRDRWRTLAEQEGKSLNAYIVSRVEGAYIHADGIIDGSASSEDPAQDEQKAPFTPSDT